jgi:hypothetical protein
MIGMIAVNVLYEDKGKYQFIVINKEFFILQVRADHFFSQKINI